VCTERDSPVYERLQSCELPMKQPEHIPLIDTFRVVASQLIMLSHLVTYGPLPHAAREILPGTIDWIYGYARIAVQVFLVISGFLAARSLAAGDMGLSPLGLIGRRYLRLVIPYGAAIVLAIISAAAARCWMTHESIPARPEFLQVLAHMVLLQDLYGIEALSAGIWYIAIDFQLYALMALLVWCGRRSSAARMVLPGLLLASLFWFNRDPAWDNCALYFFGSYGLGAAAWWASQRRNAPTWICTAALIACCALMVDFRLRIAVALAVALALGLSRRSGLLAHCMSARPLEFLGRISYSVFLVHFPVCLLVNALFVRLGWLNPAGAVFGLLAAWALSLALADQFYRWIEAPAGKWRILRQPSCS